MKNPTQTWFGCLSQLTKNYFLAILLALGQCVAWADTSDAIKMETQKPIVKVMPIALKNKCNQPVYPKDSKRKGEQGNVLLKVTIGIEGKVTNAEVVQSSGFPNLDLEAVRFATACQFSPMTLDGNIVKSEWVIPVNFKLEEPEKHEEGFLGNRDQYSLSEKNKAAIETGISKSMYVRFVGKSEIIQIGCRMWKLPMVTASKLQPFQFYLVEAFNEELRRAGKYSDAEGVLNIDFGSINLVTVGKGLWEIEVFVSYENRDKVKINVIFPFSSTSPRKAPCENPRVVFPELASEIIHSIVSDNKLVSLINQ